MGLSRIVSEKKSDNFKVFPPPVQFNGPAEGVPLEIL